MKRRITLGIALILPVMLATPAIAYSVLYTNGPISAVTANDVYGHWLSANSFTLTQPSTITAFEVGLWVDHGGGTPASIVWIISANDPNFLGGTFINEGTTTFSSNTLYCSACGWLNNNDIYTSRVDGLSVSLAAGTYYLELGNGTTSLGYDIAGWDVNGGPSQAYLYRNEFPYDSTQLDSSDAFTIYGATNVPEPGTLVLLATGLLGLASVVRRRFSL